MNSQHKKCLGWGFLASVIVPFVAPAPAKAVHIARSLDIPGVRGAIAPNEGYLSYHLFSPFGEERTGWTDIRHPAMDGTIDKTLGYDRSDFSVSVNNIIVTDQPGNTATPKLNRDFDFANQIYAQIGISVVSTGAANFPYNNVTFPIDFDERTIIQGQNRQADPVVNNYYVKSTINGDRGITRSPTAFAGPPATYAISVTDSAANDTFAHELGHFLLDQHQFNNSGDTVHSSNASDLMASGSLPRKLPSNNQKGQGNTAPGDPGLRPIGNLGIVDHFDESVKLNGMGSDINQIEAMHRSPFVQHTRDNGFTYGDRADFDWVEDNIPLELATTTGDNHPGIDFMVWQIGPIAPSPHIGHDHDDWGELNLPAFTGDTFRAIDVISQIARYADMDVDDTGKWSARESALDYLLDFSLDGTSWKRGKPIVVFKNGWTFKSKAEDYVARWLSPFDAKFVRIAGYPLGGRHDGNTQIDAIIAAHITVPEPSTLLGTALTIGLGALSRKQKKTKSKD